MARGGHGVLTEADHSVIPWRWENARGARERRNWWVGMFIGTSQSTEQRANDGAQQRIQSTMIQLLKCSACQSFVGLRATTCAGCGCEVSRGQAWAFRVAQCLPAPALCR